MRRAVIIALGAMLVGIFASYAIAEDGGPPNPRPLNCENSVDLSGGENFGGTNVRDCVDGGSGSNTIATYGDADWANGKGGSDPMYGGDWGDVLYGGNEGDHIEGQAGADYLYAGCPGGCDQKGGQFKNVLIGGSGDDVLAMRNNVGADDADCGGGFDTVYMDDRTITKNGEFDQAQADCEDVRRG